MDKTYPSGETIDDRKPLPFRVFRAFRGLKYHFALFCPDDSVPGLSPNVVRMGYSGDHFSS